MTGPRYVRITFPWHATVDVTSPYPSLFLGRLFQQTLRFGNPGNRRFGWARAALARRDLPRAKAVSWFLRKGRRTSSSGLDAIAADLERAWAGLCEKVELPCSANDVSFLVLRRAAAQTVFVFCDSADPLLVLKVPGDEASIDHEANALHAVAAARISPIYLGRVGPARVQTGLRGAPLRVELVDAQWFEVGFPKTHKELIGGLERLARSTAREERPIELDLERWEMAIDRIPLGPAARRVAEAALREAQLTSAVIRHSDTSAQNCLIDDGKLSGLVDWEFARMSGVPGYDAWNAALALFEHGLGLKSVDEATVRTTFRRAWTGSTHFDRWRAAARETAIAGGASEELLDALEVTFFVRHLVNRWENPRTTGERVATAIELLEVACAS